MSDRQRFVSGRDDGRFGSTAGFIHASLKALDQPLAFDPEMPAGDLPRWREQVRGRLRELLRFPEIPPQPEPRMLSSEPRDGYELQKWEVYPEPLAVVPFLVLIPDDIPTPAPAVLCFPGSSRTKEGLAGEVEESDDRHWERNTMALRYARAGIVAIAADNPGVGELRGNVEPNRAVPPMNLLWLGRNFEGLTTLHKLPMLEWARSRPWIDAERIAVSGHSLGAKPALNMTVLDEGIRALVYNDFVCDFRERTIAMNLELIALHQYIPDFCRWLDSPDLLAAAAPRHVLITEGGRTVHIERIRRAWEMLGAAGNFEVHYYPRYADAAERLHEDEPMPEGLTMEEYFEYANIDVAQHAFKHEVAVPWLARVLEAGT